MKAFISALTLLLLSLAASQSVSAHASSVTYNFTLDDGYTKYVEFDAKKQVNGSTSGTMFYSDEATVVFRDVDGAGDPVVKYPGFSITAQFDDMVVNKNQAVMSGTVVDSSIREFIGQRVLLTVEDNGTDGRVPDQLTWGIYKPVERKWVASDAELKDDPGVGLRWWATDAEVKDDRGIQMPRDETIGAQSFPVASYSFAEVRTGAGDIIVQP